MKNFSNKDKETIINLISDSGILNRSQFRKFIAILNLPSQYRDEIIRLVLGASSSLVAAYTLFDYLIKYDQLPDGRNVIPEVLENMRYFIREEEQEEDVDRLLKKWEKIHQNRSLIEDNQDFNILELALDLISNGSDLNQDMFTQRFIKYNISKNDLKLIRNNVNESKSWIQNDNIVGFGIAPKIVNNKETNQLSIKIYVETKKTINTIEDRHRIPQTFTILDLGRVFTDVEEIGKPIFENLRTRIRPVKGGYSVSHVSGKGGSLACLVSDKNDPEKYYFLSNNHIFANNGFANVGDKIIQPSNSDGGNKKDSIAELERWVDFNTSGSFKNRVDAAIASPLSKGYCSSEIEILNQPPQGIAEISYHMEVQKVGKSSEHSWGRVKDPRFRVKIPVTFSNGKTLKIGFIDQVLCTKYSKGGDSGSLVLDENMLAVGLHMGGTGNSSFFNPIKFVLEELQVNLVIGKI